MKTNQHKLIFIVEDDPLYSLMLDYNISNESVLKCISFRTGEECIESLTMNPLLIVLDYELPGMNGKETLRRIKELKPEMPVVILSGNKDQKLIRELLNEGVYEYLFKEKDSIKKLKKIINSIQNTFAKVEEKVVFRMKTLLLFLFIIALTVVAVYFKKYFP